MITDDASVPPPGADVVLVINPDARDGTPARHIHIRAGPSQDFYVHGLSTFYEYGEIIVSDPVPIDSWSAYLETQRGLDSTAEFDSSDDPSIREHALKGFALLSTGRPGYDEKQPDTSAYSTMVLMILPAYVYAIAFVRFLLNLAGCTYDVLLTAYDAFQRTAYVYKFLQAACYYGRRTFDVLLQVSYASALAIFRFLLNLAGCTYAILPTAEATFFHALAFYRLLLNLVGSLYACLSVTFWNLVHYIKFLNRLRLHYFKATKLVHPVVHAVAPLVNFWHTVRSGQNASWPASFKWSDNILPPAPRLVPPSGFPVRCSLSYPHGGSQWSMGGQLSDGFGGSYTERVEGISSVLADQVVSTPLIFQVLLYLHGRFKFSASMAWWTWFRWYKSLCCVLIFVLMRMDLVNIGLMRIGLLGG